MESELDYARIQLIDLYERLERGCDVRKEMMKLVEILCTSGLLGKTDQPKDVLYSRWYNS